MKSRSRLVNFTAIMAFLSSAIMFIKWNDQDFMNVFIYFVIGFLVLAIVVILVVGSKVYK